VDAVEPLSRTGQSEWRVIDDLYDPLRRFAAVVAPGDLDPDDLLQEAIVGVLRSKRLSDIEHPASYLRRAVLNTVTSHNRRMGRLHRAMARYRADAGVATAPVYPSDLSELDQLPPRERGALYLHEVEGYRYREIADMLGCSEAAARKAGTRGRRRLHHVYVEEVAQ